MTTQPAIKKPKQPLDYILRQMHDAMEMVFAYDHDPNSCRMRMISCCSR
jgi:hypothetical protein